MKQASQLTEKQMEQTRKAVNDLVMANLKPKHRENTKTIKLSKARQRIFAEKLCKDEIRASDMQWTYWLLGTIMHANKIPVRFPVKLEENFRRNSLNAKKR